MSFLEQIIGYLCENYPYPNDLSKSRLTKLVYLADWKAVLTHGKQITDIQWVFNHYGPYVDDIYNEVCQSKYFTIKVELNDYGAFKEIIKLKQKILFTLISDEEKKVLDFVIKKTSHLNYSNFLRLVYSTYPILVSEKYLELDLVNLAEKYRSLEPIM